MENLGRVALVPSPTPTSPFTTGTAKRNDGTKDKHMNGVQLLNLIAWIGITICIWEMPLWKFFITLGLLWLYGLTEYWLGKDEKK